MKEKNVFVCQQCGQNFSKWMGKCTECGAWNSVVEERVTASSSRQTLGFSGINTPRLVSDVSQEKVDRVHSGISELDSVLGGGLVPGSVVLLGGEPGIGKSTLLLQAADQFARNGLSVLYVSGEESASQIALRASRLEIKGERLWVVSEGELTQIKNHIDKHKPSLLILDSIQTIYSNKLESQPGTVGQLRECAYEIINLAKARGLAAFLVGHVTKDGNLAGPKVLEHMVDVVLYFEGTNSHAFRLLRTIKNRFGSTNEVGVFEMIGKGLKPVSNPSELFLSERPSSIPGSTIVASLEGSRPLLVEVQALASPSGLAIPRRTAIGFDHNRLCLLVAILEKRAGYQFYDQDVYLNVAGGLRLTETAVDLGIAAALISSHSGQVVSKESLFLGEVGLGGEVRSIPQAALRLKEAERIGLKRAYLPRRSADEIKAETGLELIAVEHIQQLADRMT